MLCTLQSNCCRHEGRGHTAFLIADTILEKRDVSAIFPSQVPQLPWMSEASGLGNLTISSLESPVHFPGRAWEVTQAPAWWIMEKRWVFLTFGQNSQFLKCLGRLNFSGIKNWLRNAQTDCTNKFAFNDGDEHHNNDNNINDNSNNNNNHNNIFLLSSPWSCRWVWS